MQETIETELMFEDNADKLEYYTDFTKDKQEELMRLHKDEQKLDLFKRWKDNGKAFTRPKFEIIPNNEQNESNNTVFNPLNSRTL